MSQTGSVFQIEATLNTIAQLRAGASCEAQRAAAQLLWDQMNELLLAQGRENALDNGWISVRRSLPPLSADERPWPVLVFTSRPEDAQMACFYGRSRGYVLKSGEAIGFDDVRLWRAAPRDSEIGVRIVDELRGTLESARDADLAKYGDSPTAFAMRAVSEDAWNKAIAALSA